MSRSDFPAGWDGSRVKNLLDHYESQPDDGGITEDNAAYESTTHTMMSVPVDMAPQVRAMIDGFLQH